jgi:hypothetical protein
MTVWARATAENSVNAERTMAKILFIEVLLTFDFGELGSRVHFMNADQPAQRVGLITPHPQKPIISGGDLVGIGRRRQNLHYQSVRIKSDRRHEII